MFLNIVLGHRNIIRRQFGLQSDLMNIKKNPEQNLFLLQI